MSFYAYILAKPNTVDISGIFYVGKGSARRLRISAPRNIYCQRVISKYGSDLIQISKFECSSEDAAFELERGLIKCLRRAGVTLTNLTDGGEGCSNPSEETRKKMSNVHRGKTLSEEQKASLSAAAKERMKIPEERAKSAGTAGKKRINKDGTEKTVFPDEVSEYIRDGWSLGRKSFSRSSPSEETIRKISEARKGSTPWNKGKVVPGNPVSEETKALISASRVGGKWINNGNELRYTKSSDLPEGWVYGKLTAN